MSRDAIFLCEVSVVAFTFFMINGILILSKSGETARTTGIVVDVWLANGDLNRKFNSKWAIVSYEVDHNKYISENRIQVPMDYKIGSKVTVLYDKYHPETLYHFSKKKMVIGIGCFLLHFFIK